MPAPTPPNPSGPAYRRGAPFREDLGYRSGTPFLLEGRVLDTEGRPATDAVLDLWHASRRGLYSVISMRGRGRVEVDPEGRWRVGTILPRGYLWRPPHVHVKVWRGERLALATQLYLPGHRRLRVDRYVREELILEVEMAGGGARAEVDLVLPRPQ